MASSNHNQSEARWRSWRRFVALLDACDGPAGMVNLNPEEVKELAALYGQVCSDLLMEQARGTDPETSEFLERTLSRAHILLQGSTRRPLWRSLGQGLRSVPKRLLPAHPHLMVVWAALLLGLGFGFVATTANEDAFRILVPEPFASSYDTQSDDPRESRFGTPTGSDQSLFASYLFQNNVRVALTALALGIFFGIPPLLVVFRNSAMLGAIAAHHHLWQQDLKFWALILPHGGIELSAIALCAAGGLYIGDAMLRPGEFTRGATLARATPTVATLALLSIPILLVAAIIESMITPTPLLPPAAKIGVGAASFLLLWTLLLRNSKSAPST